MDSSENQAVSHTTRTPPGFYGQKLWGFIFPALEPWAVQSGLGCADFSLFHLEIKKNLQGTNSEEEEAKNHLQVIPPNFYPPHVSVGPSIPPPLLLPLSTTPHLHVSPPVSMSLPFLSVWMNVVFLNLWLSDFHIPQFSDNSGCYLF